jgi:hypothetical protein
MKKEVKNKIEEKSGKLFQASGHQIIPDFMDDPEYYKVLQDLIFGNYNEDYAELGLPDFQWIYGKYTKDSPPQMPLSYFFSHIFYCLPPLEHKISFRISPHYDMMQPILGLINEKYLNPNGMGQIKSVIRCRANYFPHTADKVHEYATHVDYNFPHTAAILSLNTCDGYTKLEDGTKIPSVDNQMLFSDGSKKHCSTTTTNSTARFNIVINFI